MEPELHGMDLEKIEDPAFERRKNALNQTIDPEFLKIHTTPREKKRVFPKKEGGESMKSEKKPCECEKSFGIVEIVVWLFAFYGSYSLGKTFVSLVSGLFQKTEIPEIPNPQ